MNYYKVGCNFSKELIDIFKELNLINSNNKIDETYGSRKESAPLTARPAFRLKGMSEEDFKNYVDKLSQIGVSFNYTLNTSFLGSKEKIQQNEFEIMRYVSFLIDSGVKTITVTLPYVAELIRRVSKNIGIEVSTIAHIDTVSQVKLWYERYGISKVCINLNKNREINFLKSVANYCNKNGIIVSLLANEFCGNGSMLANDSCATGCIYRDHCYQLHSIGYEKNAFLENNYPMGNCISSRSKSVIWLKMNFIRPEDTALYNTIGINHFKITGRTGETEHLKRVIRSYMLGKYNGNVLELWKHLETIYDKDEKTFVPQNYIENRKLNGFLDFWFSHPNHICANEVCGETCKYCDDFYNSTLS